MPPELMQNSLGCPCLRVQNGIPSSPERKKAPPLHSPSPPLGCGQPAPPLQCWRLRNTVPEQEWNDFRTGKPVPISELLATNIASTGGAGVRHGEDGGDVFFARDGLGCDGVALRSLCACVRMLCGAWLVLSLLGTACTNMGRVVLYIYHQNYGTILSIPIGPIAALGW